MHRPPRAIPLASLAVLVLLALPGCGGGGTGRAADPGPGLRVVSSNPPDGGQAVAVDATILVTFNLPLDPATVQPDSLTVGAPGLGEAPGRTVLDGSGTDRTLRWTPTSSMAALASHQCVVSPGLRGEGGERLAGATDFTFRTADDVLDIPLPSSDALRPTLGRLNIGRRSHTATRLAGGLVLVAGGFRQGTAITDTAELYGSEVYTLVGSRMHQERADHTATLLPDGRVLLAGGYFEAAPGQLATTAHAEVFDPSTGDFDEVGTMTTARVDHAAILLPDGRVLVTGGSRLDGSFLTDLASAELFDPATNQFTALPNAMLHTHSTHVMEPLGESRVLIAGGSDTDLRPEIFDTASFQFVALPPAAQDGVRFGAMGAAFPSGAVCVAGGDDLGTVLNVQPNTGLVQNTGSGLSRPRVYGTATRYGNDRILVAGGFDKAQGFLSLHSIDLVVEGGIAGSRTFATEMRFPVGLALHTATLLGNGRILLCGGINEDGGQPELDVSYVFTPEP